MPGDSNAINRTDSVHSSGTDSPFFHAARILLEEKDFSVLAKKIFDIARTLTDARSGYVALQHDGGSGFDVLFYETGGQPCPSPPSPSSPMQELRDQAIASRSTVVFNRFMETERARTLPQGHERVENVLFAPLVVDTNVLGVLCLGNKPQDFSLNDVAAVTALAELLASRLKRNLAEQALEKSEKKYRTIVENINDALVIHDLKGTILDVNDTLCKRLGYTREDLVGAHLSKFAGPENLLHFKERMRSLTETGSNVFEGTHLRWDGTAIPVEISAKAVSLQGDGIIQSFVRDISDRKKMETSLRESEELFRSTIEQSADGFMMTDANMRITEWNLAMETIFGYTRGEMIGKRLPEFQYMTMPAEQRSPELLERLNRAMGTIRGQRAEEFMHTPQEMLVESKGGERKTVQLAAFPVFTSMGVCFCATIRDITLRKKTEEALRASEERFATAFEHSPLLLSISDIETGTFIEVNRTFLEVSGFSRDEVIGKTSVEIGWITAGEREKIKQQFREAGYTRDLELTCKARDNRQITCRYAGEIIAIGGEKRLLVVAQDITEDKLTRTTLIETDRLLKKAQSIAHLGHFRYDPATGTIAGSDVLHAITGLYGERHRMDDALALIEDPAVRERMLTLITRCIEQAEPFEHEFWIRSTIGERKYVNVIGEAEKNAGGTVTLMVGTIQDITERKLMDTVLSENERKYRLLFENMVEGFAVHEIITDDAGNAVDFRFIDANAAHERHSGLIRSEIIGKTIKEVMPHVSDEQIERYGRVALTGEPISFEYYSETFKRHLRVSAFSPQRGRFATIFEDISAEKQAAEALRASEERFRQLAESIHAVFWVGSPDWKRIEYVSPSYEEFWGRSCRSLYDDPLSWLEALPFEDMEKVGAAIESVTDTDWNILRFPEYRVRRPDGSVSWISATAYPIRDDHNAIIRVAGLAEDITERKNIQEALRHEQEMATLYFEIAGVMLLVLDGTASIILINKKGCAILGYEAGELVGKNWIDLCIPQDQRMRINQTFRQLTTGNNPQSTYAENEVLCKNGDRRLIAWHNALVRGNENQIVATVSSGEDITARRRAEAALAESERRNRDLLKAIPDIIFKVLNSGVILDVKYDHPSQLMLPPEQIEGSNIYDLPLQKGDTEKIKRTMAMALSTGEVHSCTYTLPSRGSDRIFEARFIRELENTAVVIVRDITESKRAEENLIKTEKLESLGQMAGGIAHDFNNLLGGVFGYLEMAKEQAEKNNAERAALYISKSLTVFDRAKGLTRQFLTFAKGGKPVKKTGDLDALLRSAVPFALTGSNVSLDLHIEGGLWPCDFDEHQIAQVVDNLAINARQAMEKGGRLDVTATNVILGAEERTHALLPGKYVRIDFKDAGPGISPDIQQKIFDPFFTTKKTGTGLGLATSYSIITRHGGSIDVQSEPGKGATFTIFLPASGKSVDPEQTETRPAKKGQGKILLMDDEHYVRDFGSGMLKNLGYSVETAKNGEDAIARWEAANKRGMPFTAGLFDLTIIGGMGGKDAAQRILSIDPGARIIVSSGYSEDPVMADPGAFGFCDGISKPYKKQELSEVLARLPQPKPRRTERAARKSKQARADR